MVKAPLDLIALRDMPLAAPRAGGWHVRLDDPARSVMTDFAERSIVTVASGDQIDAALQHMKHAGVRSAFVHDEGRPTIVGMITAYHILSERPVVLMQSLRVHRDEVTVADTMDPVVDWHVVRLADVDRATVATILATFRKLKRSHLAVIEQDGGGVRLRGVFSATKLLRLTQQPVEPALGTWEGLRAVP